MGMPERSRDISRGVLPVSVMAIMAATLLSRLAACMAAMAMTSSMLSALSLMGRSVRRSCQVRSAPRIMRSMACTVSAGKSPTAVSADSITASVPSSTALATSETSARVGWGLWIMDSIIWVAVITKRFSARARRMMCFCTPTSSASPISTARSPRATMTPSEATMIASRVSSSATASARSILAMMPPLPPALW